jgi:hypothetical protein
MYIQVLEMIIRDNSAQGQLLLVKNYKMSSKLFIVESEEEVPLSKVFILDFRLAATQVKMDRHGNATFIALAGRDSS